MLRGRKEFWGAGATRIEGFRRPACNPAWQIAYWIGLKEGRNLNIVQPNTVLSALAEVEGDAFERFFKEFGAGVFGLTFVPLGGRHDGGADAFAETGIFEASRRNTFFQASTEANHRDKLRKTIARLIDYGREVASLSYFTSRIIPDIDDEELELSNKHNVNLTIYDAQWIANRVNTSEITRAAFENHLRHYSNLAASDRKNSTFSTPSDFNVNAAVFISQHSLMTPSKEGIRGAVLDSLALFVLEEACVQGEPFITSIEIYDRMKATFPVGFHFSDQEVAERLALMSTKMHPFGRQIVWDEREAGYALPYDARTAVDAEHTAFESLIFRVREEVRTILGDVHAEEGMSSEKLDDLVSTAIHCLELLFMDEGLRIAQFLDGVEEDISEGTVQDVVMRALRDRGLLAKGGPAHVSALMEVMRRFFYQASSAMREYLSYLSRTYALLFSLKYDLKISDYFSDMKSNFRLLVGSDVIIQALSESRLNEEDRVTHAMLRALMASGAELILTDHAVDEVYTHIVAANEEYTNHYATQDPYITMEIARQSDRILIRSYYYAKLRPAAINLHVTSWGQFVGQFLPYAEIRSAEARLALRTYLREKFSLRLETKGDLEEVIDREKQNRLAKSLMNRGIKDRWELALNDAAHVLLIYALRAENNEIAKASPVGYRTWWLTSETRIQKGFEDLIGQYGKAIMRPQVAAQLLAFAPNADEVKLAYGNIMPSLVGIRLGNRSHPSVLRGMLDKVAEVSADDPARLKAEMERLANRYKAHEERVVERSLKGFRVL